MKATKSYPKFSKFSHHFRNSAVDISVVIPSFNSSSYITETLESILASANYASDINSEIIVVDGASTDNTMDLIREFANRNSSIAIK